MTGYTTEELNKIADEIIKIIDTPDEEYQTLKKAYSPAADMIDLCRKVFG